MSKVHKALLMAWCMLSASCADNELSRAVQSYSGISPEDIQIGNKVSAILQASYPVLHDQIIAGYLRSIRASLLAASAIREPPGDVVVLREDSVFAYTLPNGDIYLSTGMLRMLQNEAELAAVIAHELGHVLRQHSRQSRIQSDQYREVLGRQRPQDLADTNLLLSFMTVSSFGNSREMELEADRLMVQLLERSANDPCAAYAMLSRLADLEQAAEGGAATTQLFDTHPATPQRLAYLKKRFGESECDKGRALHPERYTTNVRDRLPPAK